MRLAPFEIVEWSSTLVGIFLLFLKVGLINLRNRSAPIDHTCGSFKSCSVSWNVHTVAFMDNSTKVYTNA